MFHGSVWPPGVHGMLPSASWIDGDGVDRGRELARGDDAGDVGEAGHATPDLLGVDDEALAEHRVQGAVDGVDPRAAARTICHTRNSWYLRTGHASALSTPTAHFSHQYGECSACAWCAPRSARPRARELALEVALAVDADVAAGRVVVVAVERPADPFGEAGRHGDREPAAGTQDPDELRDRELVGPDVLEHLRRDDAVEGGVGERQRERVGVDRAARERRRQLAGLDHRADEVPDVDDDLARV